jgi:uncharacterized protein YjcR
MSKAPRKELTARQKRGAYMHAIELKTGKDIAETLGVSEQSVSKWKHNPLWQAEVDRLLKEEWREACKELQKLMIKKARGEDFKALAYVLDSNGYQAPTEFKVEQKTIEVTIDEEDEDE